MSINIKHNKERLMKILLFPIISEKATFVYKKNKQVIFCVMRDATKLEIKAAIELFFKIKVKAVQVVNRLGKQKRSGKNIGRRKHMRHAFICLHPDQEIDFIKKGEIINDSC